MKIESIKHIFPYIRVARFNLTVWKKPGEDSLCFIGREVIAPGPKGEPDTGILKFFELDKDGNLTQEKILWEPSYDGINLEDPRALELSGEDLIIGLTAVLRDKKGHPIPFPAIVAIDSLRTWDKKLPPFQVIDVFGPGKNITPIDKSTYLFRPNSKAYSHKLLLFSFYSTGPEKITDIEFPNDLPWANWKIGTTMSPIWLTSDEALFIIHGISLQKINGRKKYIYSIGRAKLIREKDKFRIIVAKDPVLTPDYFLDENGIPLVEELHPELRRVVYSCGGIIKKNTNDIFSLYVNVGDRATFEVDILLSELTRDLF